MNTIMQYVFSRNTIVYIFNLTKAWYKCGDLPEIGTDVECTQIGLPAVLNRADTCYKETGIGRRFLI